MKSIDKDLVSLDEIKEVPSGSIFEDKSILCFRLAYFPVPEIYVLGHWIIRWFRPLLLFVLFVYEVTVGALDCVKYVPDRGWRAAFLVLISIADLCVLISYVATIARGPGYLSYNYNRVDGTEDSWESRMANFVTYQEQLDFAKQNEKPPRASFSISARRYVLRADHYCLWTESWIGLRNLRYFTLVMSWAFISGVLWILAHFWWFKNNLLHFEVRHLLTYVGLIVVIVMIVFSTYYLFKSLVNLKNNVTFIEKWKNSATNFKKDNCLDNFAEVCGSKKYCPLWIFPCIPFEPVEDGFYKNMV